ncbi:MAG TPA: DUF2231 domain-containing protein [Sphingomicrobium sp.]|jgi:uncharacterized membrane protein
MADTLGHRRSRPLAISGRRIASTLLAIPIVCFAGAVLTDWAYLGSDGHLTWLFFSTWLIPAGLVVGGFAAVALLIDAVRLRGGWLAFLLFVAAWAVELINSFVHMRDGWTAVAGLGIILSVIGAVLALLSGWFAAGDRPVAGWEERR